MISFYELRAKLANLIAPVQPTDMTGVERFVYVRFFLPNTGNTEECYDRQDRDDMKAWDENQRLYSSQIFGYGAAPLPGYSLLPMTTKGP